MLVGVQLMMSCFAFLVALLYLASLCFVLLYYVTCYASTRVVRRDMASLVGLGGYQSQGFQVLKSW
jgi:hypothetical protein